MNHTIQDQWAQRILEPRYKNDPQLQKDIEQNFIQMRNTVLHNAHVVISKSMGDHLS